MVPSTAHAAPMVCLWLATAVRAQSSGAVGCNFVEFGFPAHSPDGGCFYNELVGEEAGRSYRAQCGEDGALTVWEHASLDCSGPATDVTATDARVGAAFECGGRFCRKLVVVEDERTEDELACAPDARGPRTVRVLPERCMDFTALLGAPASAFISGCDETGRVVVGEMHLDTAACDSAAPVDLFEFFSQFEADCYLACYLEAPGASGEAPKAQGDREEPAKDGDGDGDGDGSGTRTASAAAAAALSVAVLAWWL